ncbi:hypothetical protein JHK87_033446 [Glycine soja]|nr:hypothetical protein JHK87_033446 [Glycine soja]
MDECKVMISRFDLNGDGMLSFEEFRIMMNVNSRGVRAFTAEAHKVVVWFGKSGCSYETYATSTKVANEGSVSKARENLNKHVQVANKHSYGQIHRDRYHQSSNSIMRSYKDKTGEDGSNQHRRSFSVSIKLLSGNKSSSSTSSVSGSTLFSFSNKSYGCQARQLFEKVQQCKFRDRKFNPGSNFTLQEVSGNVFFKEDCK